MLDFGILGMNARNLQYIKKFNPRKAIRLADNKLKTKTFLAERGIPVPGTYDVIKNRQELYDYDFGTLPVKDFIVKPNKGSRGRGIYRVKRLDEVGKDNGVSKGSESSEIGNGPVIPAYTPIRSLPSLSSIAPKTIGRFDRLFGFKSSASPYQYKVSGEIWTENFFKRHLLDIVDGKNSMTQGHDTILLEELLIPGNGFEDYCEFGLADIRVIVFNLVPVAAMLRMPTEASDGKANLDRGAIGFGVDVSTGRVTSVYDRGEIHKHQFPEQFAHLRGKKIPYRNDILHYSAKIQYFANLGYLALDRVVTEEGPKILEINARAGLKFQLAAILPLKKRLDKIKTLKVTTPEKGVEIAKSLFSDKKADMISRSKVLYLSQHGTLSLQSTQQSEEPIKETIDMVVDVDVHRTSALVSPDIYEKLTREGSAYTLELHDSHIRFKNFKVQLSEKLDESKIVIGKGLVENYYLKPIKKIFSRTSAISSEKLLPSERDELHILDEKLQKIGRSLNLSRILKPVNYLEQLDLFIDANGQYNPVFEYKRPTQKKMDEIEKKLIRYQKKYFGPSPSFESPFAVLFRDKIDELLRKHTLVQAYMSQDYDAILQANIALYGEINAELLVDAKKKIFEHVNDPEVLGEYLSSGEVRARIKKKLLDVGIKGVRIVYDSEMTARMSVVRGRTVTIKISQGVQFREKDLEATLEHEIGVHIVRWIAGRESGRHILRNGTADFLADEEGLAVWKSLEVLPEGYIKQGMYYKYFMIDRAGQHDFVYLAGVLRSMREYSLRQSFNGALRLKKGIINAGIVSTGAVNYRGKIYADGLTKVEKRVANGGDVSTMMVGKVKLGEEKVLK